MDVTHSLDAHRPPQIGVIVLAADETLEPDFRRLLPPPIEVLASRVPSGEHAVPETLRAMDGLLTEAAARLPRGARFAAVGYGCTSATAQIGADRVHAQIAAGIGTPESVPVPGPVPVSDPCTACIAACRAMGLTRITLVSPYVADVSAPLIAAFEAGGLTVPSVASFNVSEEARVVRIDTASIIRAAIEAARDDASDAVFLSCTNLRTLDAIPTIEDALGKPVLSSNQVLAWHLARLAGVEALARIPGALGRLNASSQTPASQGA